MSISLNEYVRGGAMFPRLPKRKLICGSAASNVVSLFLAPVLVSAAVVVIVALLTLVVLWTPCLFQSAKE